MIEDHYATLGVLPAADDVVIRAAYLALMRRYHPDRNASPDAIDHARAVIAAFAILGDPEKRMRYDWDRRRAAEAAAGLSPQGPRMVTPRAMAITLIALLSLVSFVALQAHFARSDPSARNVVQAEPAPARTIASAVPADNRTPAPPPTPDAPLRAADAPSQTKLAIRTPPPAPIEFASVASSVPRRAPPPVRQPKPDIRTLNVAQPKPSEPRKVAALVVSKPAVAPKAAVAPPRPNENILALERNGTAFFNQSYRHGKSEKRVALTSSRNDFLARREACKSDSCLREASLRHVREINTIMQGARVTP